MCNDWSKSGSVGQVPRTLCHCSVRVDRYGKGKHPLCWCGAPAINFEGPIGRGDSRIRRKRFVPRVLPGSRIYLCGNTFQQGRLGCSCQRASSLIGLLTNCRNGLTELPAGNQRRPDAFRCSLRWPLTVGDNVRLGSGPARLISKSTELNLDQHCPARPHPGPLWFGGRG